MNKEITIKNVRLSFSDNMVVSKAIGGGKPRWTCNLIFENNPTELKKVRDAIDEITKVEFAKGKPLGPDDICLRDGNTNVNKEGEVYAGYVGNFFLSAARADNGRQEPPLIVNGRLEPVRPGSVGYPQSGDYVNVKIEVYSQNGVNDKKNDYGRKINCTFSVVQFVRKGESFGGGAAPSVAGLEPVEEDPTAEL